MSYGLAVSEGLEKAVLGSILLDNNIASDIDIAPYMFETWRKVADMLWAQLQDTGAINAQTLGYECSKRGICSKEEIFSLVANADGEVGRHATDLKTEWQRRQEIEIHQQGLEMLLAGQDPTAVAVQAEKQRELISGLTGDKNKSRVQMCNGYLDKVAQARNRKGPVGYSTGYKSIDILTGGVGLPNYYRIWAARPGMGKSTLTWRVAENAAAQGCPVAVFSGEMIFDQLAEKTVQRRTGISRSDLQQGKITDKDWQDINDAVSHLYDLPIYVEEDNDINKVVSKARQYVRKYGVKLIIIDYLQLLRDYSQRYSNRNSEVEEISRALAKLARTEKVDVIALSQLSRAVEQRGGDKIPMLSDLRDSGAIEQDGGQIAFIYRPEYYQITEDAEGNSLIGAVRFIQPKDRYAGQLGSAYCQYLKANDDYKDAGLGEYQPEEEIAQEVAPYTGAAMPKPEDDEPIPF